MDDRTLALALSAAIDLASTKYAMNAVHSARMRGERVEWVEVMPQSRGSFGRIVLVKAVATVGIELGVRKLERDGHRGWARALRGAAVLTNVGAAIHNVRQVRR